MRLVLKMESSLTAPEDRNPDVNWKPDQSAPALTNEQTIEAMKEQVNRAYIQKFPRKERTFADPPPPLQTYGLISFIPAKGATPNKNGVYGYAKSRGNYATELEAEQRAEFIMRNVDSYNPISFMYVGRPFPLTEDLSYSEEVSEIEIRKQAGESISQSIKKMKDKEQKAIQEVKDREKELLSDIKRAKEGEENLDDYITLKLKKAQLTWTWKEYERKMENVKETLIKTRKEVIDMEERHPEYNKQYMKRYLDARKEAGIKEDETTGQGQFMKFMVEDVELPF